MQTKKKLPARNATQGHASPRACRPHRKVSDNTQIAEKRATELITSSARKQRFVQISAGVLSRESRDSVSAKTRNTSCTLARGDAKNSCFDYDTTDNAPIGHKGLNDGTAQCVLETIFSPAFHISKDGGGVANGADIIKMFKREDQEVRQDCGLKESQVDASCVDLEISYPFGEEMMNSSRKKTSGSETCSSDMDVDLNISSEQFNPPNRGSQMPLMEINFVDSNCSDDLNGKNLSAEVSAIYLAMQHSKLECVDEHSQDSMSTDVCADDDGEEYDDFDPYLFIKNLPDLSSVVPTFRPVLLPKQTRSCPRTTLVLDLDETLVHSTLECCVDADFTFPVHFNLKEHTVYVKCRPHLKDFMERVAHLFEIIIFTASQSIYAEQLLNVLDPKRRVFRHRVYRESCVFVEGNYVKDLSVLGRDLAHMIIIDNSPQAFGFQVNNGIPIESWFDDRSDQELLLLLPFLESLVGVEDVRPLIAKKFNLQERIAAAVYPPLTSNKGDPFER